LEGTNSGVVITFTADKISLLTALAVSCLTAFATEQHGQELIGFEYHIGESVQPQEQKCL
jgi:hypothetical protein